MTATQFETWPTSKQLDVLPSRVVTLGEKMEMMILFRERERERVLEMMILFREREREGFLTLHEPSTEIETTPL